MFASTALATAFAWVLIGAFAAPAAATDVYPEGDPGLESAVYAREFDGWDVWSRDGSSVAERLQREPGIWVSPGGVGAARVGTAWRYGRPYELRYEGLRLPSWMVDDLRLGQVEQVRTSLEGPQLRLERWQDERAGWHGGARARMRAADASVGASPFADWRGESAFASVDVGYARHDLAGAVPQHGGAHRRFWGSAVAGVELGDVTLKLLYVGAGRRSDDCGPADSALACFNRRLEGHALALQIDAELSARVSFSASSAVRRVVDRLSFGGTGGLGGATGEGAEGLGSLGVLSGLAGPSGTTLSQQLLVAVEAHEHLQLRVGADAELGGANSAVDGDRDDVWRGHGAASLALVAPFELGDTLVEAGVAARVERVDAGVYSARTRGWPGVFSGFERLAAAAPGTEGLSGLDALSARRPDALTVATARVHAGVGRGPVFTWLAWQHVGHPGMDEAQYESSFLVHTPEVTDELELGLRLTHEFVEGQAMAITRVGDAFDTAGGLVAFTFGPWAGVRFRTGADLVRVSGLGAPGRSGPHALRFAVSHQARELPLRSEVGTWILVVDGDTVALLDARLNADLGDSMRVGFEVRNLGNAEWSRSIGDGESGTGFSAMVTGELGL